jgi:hypothetical protein
MRTISPRNLVHAALLAIAYLFNGPTYAVDVRWVPDFRFPGTFFPSFAISAAGKDSNGPIDKPQVYGFLESGSFGAVITQASAGTRIKLMVEVPEIGVSGQIESSAPADGSQKVLVPRLSWSQSRLAAITQPISTEVVFRIFVDGVQAGEERRPVRVRAVNDMPLRVCKKPNRCSDYSRFMAAFVNENHPGIDSILRAALDIPAMPVKQWTGTLGSQDDAFKQVWALWYLFQRNKVTYSSITTVADERQDLFSQTIRPLSQSLRTSQANCIDGTVLFASILRKIGIEPLIVLVPGHAFLGFFVDAEGKKPVFLETTMLNDANNPFNQRGPTKSGKALAKFLGSDIHMDKSWQSFTEALEEGQRKYNIAAPHIGKDPGYMIIQVLKARKTGILPLPL